MKNNKSKPIKVNKGWGHELIFVNTSEYCGKLLVFMAGKKSSMHYHCLKHETWYIASGKILMKWIDPTNGTKHEDILVVGDVITNERGYSHQVEAIEDSVIFEVSTQHFDTDSYRIEIGDVL